MRYQGFNVRTGLAYDLLDTKMAMENQIGLLGECHGQAQMGGTRESWVQLVIVV